MINLNELSTEITDKTITIGGYRTDVRDIHSKVQEIEETHLWAKLARMAQTFDGDWSKAIGLFLITIDTEFGNINNGDSAKVYAMQNVRRDLCGGFVYYDDADGTRHYIRRGQTYQMVADYVVWEEAESQRRYEERIAKEQAERVAWQADFGRFVNPKTGKQLTSRAVTSILLAAGIDPDEFGSVKAAHIHIGGQRAKCIAFHLFRSTTDETRDAIKEALEAAGLTVVFQGVYRLDVR